MGRSGDVGCGSGDMSRSRGNVDRSSGDMSCRGRNVSSASRGGWDISSATTAATDQKTA